MALIPFIIGDESDEVLATSYLGTPFFSTLIFDETKILDDPDVKAEEAETIDRLELGTVLMTINKSKNIVKTEVQGRVGTVKEYISDGDYTIRVQGQLTTPSRSKAPVELATQLNRFLSLGQSLEVAGKFLEIFDIETIVIISYSIAEKEGTRNEYDFSINMESEEPIELTIGNESTEG